MKKIYTLVFLLFILFANQLINAQCTGTPSGFSVTPLSQTICAGTQASFTITTSGNTLGITFQWQSSTVSAVGPFVNINTPGTDMTYTTGTITMDTWFNLIIKCNNSQQSISIPAAVTVSACAPPCAGQPATTAILPPSHTLCAGDVATMSLSTTYTDSGITYLWGSSSAAGGPFTAIPNATISSYTSGSLQTTTYYNVTVTCANSSLSTVASHSVSVIQCTACSGTPGPNSVSPLNHSICAGSATSMTVTNSYTASGYTYQWQTATVSAVGPFSGINGATLNAFVTPILNTTTYYNVVITCTNSGKSIIVPHTVSVLSCTTPCSGSPASTSVVPVSQTICAGSTPLMMGLTTFYDFSGMSYQWSSSSVQAGPYLSIPGATLSSYAGSALFANTFYSVMVTCTNSQGMTTATHSVAVVNCSYCVGAPSSNTILPEDELCEGVSYTLNLSNSYTASGITYQWNSSSTSSLGPFTTINGAVQNSLVTIPLAGKQHYQVAITCANSGQTTKVLRSYDVVLCQGLKENENIVVRIYPNPVNDGLNVEVATGPIDVTITDLLGRNLLTGHTNQNKMSLNVLELPSGVYFVRIKHNTFEETVKIIRE